jgi:peptide-methionine (S)-S-oxide reductase
MNFGRQKAQMVEPANALPGRTDQFMPIPEKHFVLDAPLVGPWPSGTETAVFALGCFWGAERVFWKTPGVYSTAVGYAGGYTPNPAYEEVCSGLTGHTEVVLVAYAPAEVTFEQLLKVFWEAHDPTQGMRQGNDVGTQYRSAIYTNNAQQQTSAEQSCGVYEEQLRQLVTVQLPLKLLLSELSIMQSRTTNSI